MRSEKEYSDDYEIRKMEKKLEKLTEKESVLMYKINQEPDEAKRKKIWPKAEKLEKKVRYLEAEIESKNRVNEKVEQYLEYLKSPEKQEELENRKAECINEESNPKHEVFRPTNNEKLKKMKPKFINTQGTPEERYRKGREVTEMRQKARKGRLTRITIFVWFCLTCVMVNSLYYFHLPQVSPDLLVERFFVLVGLVPLVITITMFMFVRLTKLKRYRDLN